MSTPLELTLRISQAQGPAIGAPPASGTASAPPSVRAKPVMLITVNVEPHWDGRAIGGCPYILRYPERQARRPALRPRAGRDGGATHADADQIGSAACRESVCQYV